MSAQPQNVWYIELRGPDAQAQLEPLLEQLSREAGLSGAELQTSPAQPELALLVSRWTSSPPMQKPLPAGAKAWVFEVVASV